MASLVPVYRSVALYHMVALRDVPALCRTCRALAAYHAESYVLWRSIFARLATAKEVARFAEKQGKQTAAPWRGAVRGHLRRKHTHRDMALGKQLATIFTAVASACVHGKSNFRPLPSGGSRDQLAIARAWTPAGTAFVVQHATGLMRLGAGPVWERSVLPPKNWGKARRPAPLSLLAMLCAPPAAL